MREHAARLYLAAGRLTAAEAAAVRAGPRNVLKANGGGGNSVDVEVIDRAKAAKGKEKFFGVVDGDARNHVVQVMVQLKAIADARSADAAGKSADRNPKRLRVEATDVADTDDDGRAAGGAGGGGAAAAAARVVEGDGDATGSNPAPDFGEKGSAASATEGANAASEAYLRFSFLATKPTSAIVVGTPDGNDDPAGTSGQFVLYNAARIATLLRRYSEEEKWPPLPTPQEVDFGLLRGDDEWELLVHVARFQSVVLEAAGVVNGNGVEVGQAKRKPASTQRLAAYLAETCRIFSPW